MIAVLQRVSEACVRVEGEVIGQIGAGLLVLLCAEKGDTEAVADKMLVLRDGTQQLYGPTAEVLQKLMPAAVQAAPAGAAPAVAQGA